MNNLQIFENPDFGQVRMVMIEDNPYFVGKDVAEILGYKNPNEAIQDHVDNEDKFLRSSMGSEMLKLFSSVKDIQNKFGRQDNWFINESGVYALVFSSKLPKAKEFKRWVTSEVLPSIRKHGAYMTEQIVEKALTSPDFLIQLATNLKKEQEARQEAEAKNFKLEHEVVGLNEKISELKPKADYVDRILKSTSLVTTTQIAKDYGMGAPTFNKKLKELKVQHNVGGQWVLTYKYQGKGYASSETIEVEKKDGSTKTVMHTKWTQKGRLFLHDLLKKHNILPMIEKAD